MVKLIDLHFLHFLAKPSPTARQKNPSPPLSQKKLSSNLEHGFNAAKDTLIRVRGAEISHNMLRVDGLVWLSYFTHVLLDISTHVLSLIVLYLSIIKYFIRGKMKTGKFQRSELSIFNIDGYF